MFDRKKLLERDIKILKFTLEEIERINKAYEEFLDEFHLSNLCEYLESRGFELYEKLDNGKRVYGYSNKFLVIVDPLGKSKLVILEETPKGRVLRVEELPPSLKEIKRVIGSYVQSSL